MSVFDNRQKAIITMLLQAKQPISLTQLQQLLQTGKRTIYYTVNKINDELQYCSLLPIQNKRGQGYYLEDHQKTDIAAILHDQELTSFLGPKERTYYLICWMLYPLTPIHIETIMQKLDVSRNSVFNDLKNVKIELENYDMDVCFDNKTGYAIHGESFNKRAVLLYYLKLLLHGTHYRSLHFLNLIEVELFYQRLIQISSTLGNEYHSDNLISIACLLSVIRHVNECFDFSLLELKDLGKTDELQLIDVYFQDFNVHERLYLAVHLLGSKAGNAINVENDENDIRLFEIAQRLCDHFEHFACIYLSDKNGLINSLYMHFKLSMYYYRLSIQIVNSLMKEVKQNYSALYQVIKMVCQELAKDFPFPISDSEVVYITMHFAGHLRKGEGKFYRHIRILIVCPSGISTSTLLRREIEDLYSNVVVVATTSSNNISEYADNIDFIVSTIDVLSEVPWIKVNTILNQEDKSRIASMMMLNFETYEMDGEQINGLFDILKKYVSETNMAYLKQDVYHYLRQGNVIVKVEEQQQLRMSAVLDEADITLLDEPIAWRSAIQKASHSLLKKNIIKEKYVDAMITLVEDYGPYIVLQNHVAIAHAKPEHGANTLGLSLLINKQNIVFEGAITVQFLFVLSNPDQEKHLHLLRDIMLLSSDCTLLKELHTMQNPHDISRRLQTFSNMQTNE